MACSVGSCFSGADPPRPIQRRRPREADLSTEQAGAQAPPWVPCPHGHQGRAQGGGCPARTRAQAAQRLTAPARRWPAMERLRRRAEFLAVAAGAKVPASAFVLQARPRDDAGPARVGFTVSKKVGTAVERNRVRRRLKEAVRRSASQAMRCGHDYVIVGRRTALTMDFERLIGELQQSLVRLHAMRGPAGAGRKRTGGEG
jgi:ribonuclease P protein component